MSATALTGLDPRLAYAAAQLEDTGWAAEICDAEWRLVWVSSQLRALLGGGTDDELGVGGHLLASRFVIKDGIKVPRGFMGDGGEHSKDFQRDWLAVNVPLMIESTPGGREALREMVPEHLVDVVDQAEPTTMPAWTALLDFNDTALEVGQVRCFGMQARDLEGRPVMNMFLYGSSLPATILALVARGNPELFQRMARLVEPGRREAAIMFADVQASGALSRRLPSAAYFSLISDLTTEMDNAIIDEGGIVGKHGGDGVTGFFLVDDLGSASAAARAAVAAGRRVSAAANRCCELHEAVESGDLPLNIGLHWGGTLYMGQVVTGGRLEVTSLGDEVNEAARIQQAARDGEILVSKSLVERLNAGDAALARIDPATATYRSIADLAGGSEKIVRDAGTLAVTALEA
jgi:class 3 adenylate cyclase